MKQLLVFAGLIAAFYLATSHATDDLPTWLVQERAIAIQKVEANISRSDAAVGSVVASPSKTSPNYYYHWTRDASLTMDMMVTLFQNSAGATRSHYHDLLLQFAQFSRNTQLAGDIGEPKYYVDGRVFDGQWCRPQTDGPATRAVALTRFATLLLDQGDTKTVTTQLYDSHLPTNTVIKADLEYVSHNWQIPSCDLWEEVRGDHFYTRMAQRRALLDGALLADRLNDPGAAAWYRLQAGQIETSLNGFWNGSLIVPTLNQTGGLNYKTSGMDSSVILAAVHSDRGDGFFPMLDSRLQATYKAQVAAFKQKFPINNVGIPGVTIGRYPEDLYNGADSINGGNPWVLLTANFAQYCYKTGIELLNQDKKTAAEQWGATGDDYLRSVRAHANPDGSLSEQIDRNTGHMMSAYDLTWSYVEFIEATLARDQFIARDK